MLFLIQGLSLSCNFADYEARKDNSVYTSAVDEIGNIPYHTYWIEMHDKQFIY